MSLRLCIDAYLRGDLAPRTHGLARHVRLARGGAV